jgi:hypothetical protein
VARQAGWFRRSSSTGLVAPAPHRRAGRRRLPATTWDDLEQLAAALRAVGPPPPAQLYRSARESKDLAGPLLHVGVGLEMLRFEHEHALHEAAVAAVRLGYSPADVARASGLDRGWLLDQLR